MNSLQRVNVRTGPGVTYRDFAAIDPGTGVEVIGQSSDGRWLNVLLEDGDEGWMAASLLRVQPTPTPFPTVTPELGEETLAQATALPTSIIGGQAVTPTLPPAVAQGASPTPAFSDGGLVVEPTDALRDLFGAEDETETEEADDGDSTDATEDITDATDTTATPRGETSLDSTPVLFTNTPSPTPTETPALVVDESVLPVIDVDAINATATALAGSGAPTATFTASPSPTPTEITATDAPLEDSTLDGDVLTPEDDRAIALETDAPPTDEITIGEEDTVTTPDADATPIPTARVRSGNESSPTNPDAVVRNGVDILAYCDDESFDAAPPDNLKSGSTVDVYWVWFASTEQQIRDHLNAAVYDIRVDGNPLQQTRQYRQPIQQVGQDYAVYWYAPVGPLLPGEHEITYSVTWNSAVFDGYQFFGPGTTTLTEEGSCSFTVYE